MDSQMRLSLLLCLRIFCNQGTTERLRVRIWPIETWLFMAEVVQGRIVPHRQHPPDHLDQVSGRPDHLDQDAQ